MQPLDSWHQNESASSLKSCFWVSVGLTHKTKQNFNCQFTNCIRKKWLFANELKDKYNIYLWKAFFTKNMNSRSLPQNKALFGLDLLAKFALFFFFFLQKCMPKIRALSSRMKGTILKGGQDEYFGTENCRQTHRRTTIGRRELNGSWRVVFVAFGPLPYWPPTFPHRLSYFS